MNVSCWLTKMVSPVIILSIFSVQASAQETGLVHLEQVQQKARSYYPQSRRKALLDQTRDLTLANLARGYLPQITVNAQATYQSDVTSVKIPLPGISIESQAKDQYKIAADVSQLLFDGGVINQSQRISFQNTEVQQKQLEVELYQLRERINQLYLSILFLDEQQKQVKLIEKDVQTGISKTEAQIKNGVAFRSELDVMQAELLKQEQRFIELQADREGLLKTLSLLTGEHYDNKTRFEKPTPPELKRESHRPELALFQSQEKLIDEQTKLVTARNLPRLSAFGQGGYGRPGLNMLDNRFDWFYIAGLRINWSLGGLYLLKNEKKILALDKKMLTLQQETFLLNNESQLSQAAAAIQKQQLLLQTDEKIIALRENIRTSAQAKLENGVMTANDYLREINALDLARQTQTLHQLQLLQSQINYQNINGI